MRLQDCSRSRHANSNSNSKRRLYALKRHRCSTHSDSQCQNVIIMMEKSSGHYHRPPATTSITQLITGDQLDWTTHDAPFHPSLPSSLCSTRAAKGWRPIGLMLLQCIIISHSQHERTNARHRPHARTLTIRRRLSLTIGPCYYQHAKAIHEAPYVASPKPRCHVGCMLSVDKK